MPGIGTPEQPTPPPSPDNGVYPPPAQSEGIFEKPTNDPSRLNEWGVGGARDVVGTMGTEPTLRAAGDFKSAIPDALGRFQDARDRMDQLKGEVPKEEKRAAEDIARAAIWDFLTEKAGVSSETGGVLQKIYDRMRGAGGSQAPSSETPPPPATPPVTGSGK